MEQPVFFGVEKLNSNGDWELCGHSLLTETQALRNAISVRRGVPVDNGVRIVDREGNTIRVI